MRVRTRAWRPARFLLLLILMAGLLAQTAPPALADDPRAELEKAQNQLEFIRQQREKTKNLLAAAYWQAEEARIKLANVESELAVATGQLAVITNQLVLAEADLKKIEAEVAEAEKQVVRHKALLSKRIRAINEEGRVNYLAVLLGSTSFSDFITRFDLLKMVVRKDSELFDKVREDKKVLDQKQAEAVARRNRLADLKAQADLRRNTVTVKRDEHAAISREKELSTRQLQAQMAAWDREEEKVQELVVEIQRKLNRQGGKFVPIYPVAKPVEVTDVFGPRLHPILKVWRPHNGMDFAANHGAPVYAIEDGLVIIAGWNEAYGWLTVIDHGNGISSWYGHSSKLLVKVNETVKQGQRIAQAGSTGWSTGPHVHLEIRVNGKPENPMNYIR